VQAQDNHQETRMDTSKTTTRAEGRDLIVSRFIAAPRARVFQAWTDGELMKQWFTPPPWKTVHVETDLRAGGASVIVMRGPEGQEFPNRGVYLEVVPNERLVFTDAYTAAWEPAEKPFMTGILTFEDETGGTRYTARVKHWNEGDREAHEAMGFHQGWAIATEQLAALVEA
jgi:uncharacterized protein YndB with AHSA1/START domain